MNGRGRLWTLMGALAWFGFFAVTVSLPSVAELPGGMSELLQLVSIVAGIALLFLVILAGESTTWPAWSRYLMFAGGAASIVLPVVLHDNSLTMRALSTFGLILISLPIGYWLGDRMEKVTNLIPLSVAMAFADIFSVFQGPSKRIAGDLTQYNEKVLEAILEAQRHVPPEQAAAAAAAARDAIKVPWINYLFVHMPVPLHEAAAVMGVGDFVILAFIFRAVWVHGLNARVVYSATLAMALLALLASLLLGLPLPALVTIAFGTMVVLWFTEPRMRRIDRQEVMLSLMVAALFIGLMAAKWFLAAAKIQ